jgi:hypothetical protein
LILPYDLLVDKAKLNIPEDCWVTLRHFVQREF